MFQNVLVLSPHTDDGELGAGGFLSKLVGKGAKVHYLAFSYAGREVLKDETAASMKVLGIKDFDILEFEKRYFYHNRQDILDYLFQYNQENDVDLVLTPSTTDLHQDHGVVTCEALRAFKSSTIFGYEMPWNNIVFNANCFVTLSEEDVEKKLASLACYKTQVGVRNYFEEDFLRGILRMRGTHVKTRYAEAFEVIKFVLDSH